MMISWSPARTAYKRTAKAGDGDGDGDNDVQRRTSHGNPGRHEKNTTISSRNENRTVSPGEGTGAQQWEEADLHLYT
jgi:hypothetical protein